MQGDHRQPPPPPIPGSSGEQAQLAPNGINLADSLSFVGGLPSSGEQAQLAPKGINLRSGQPLLRGRFAIGAAEQKLTVQISSAYLSSWLRTTMFCTMMVGVAADAVDAVNFSETEM